jgi:hypothetical protein
MNNLKKFEGKAVKNQNAVKGGGNGKGTRKASDQDQMSHIPLL